MLKKGIIITCPNCNLKIAEVIKDIAVGDRLTASSFKGIDKPLVEYTSMNCHACGTGYSRFTGKAGIALHTEKGWSSACHS